MRQRKAGNAAKRAFFAPSAIFCRGKEGARTAARPNIAAVVGLFVLLSSRCSYLATNEETIIAFTYFVFSLRIFFVQTLTKKGFLQKILKK